MSRSWNQVPALHIYRKLTDDGTATGEKDHAQNFSIVNRFAYIENTDIRNPMILWRMIVLIKDANGMSADEYGKLGSELTNGIFLYVKDENDNVVLDITDGVPVKTNAEWGEICYDVGLQDWSAGKDNVLVRFTFANSGSPLVLPPGYKFGVLLQDDFSALDAHRFKVEGFQAHEGTFY